MNNQGNKTLAIIGIVCGAVAIVFSFIIYANIVGLAAGIVGIVLAIKAKKSFEGAGEASPLPKIALILAIVGTVLSAIFFFTCTLCAICLCATGTAANNLSTSDVNQLSDALNSAFSSLS